MKLAPQSREILRQYKALINARRRDVGHLLCGELAWSLLLS